MGGGSLWNFVVRLGLHGVNQVGKFHRILNKKYRHVVAHQIEHAFVRVELHCESPHITREIRGATRARDRRKSNEDGRPFLWILQETGLRILGHRFVHLEVTVSASTAGVHDALWDSLVIEVSDLFTENEVFQECRTALARLQSVLIIIDGGPLIRGQRFAEAALGVTQQIFAFVFFVCWRRNVDLRNLLDDSFLHLCLPSDYPQAFVFSLFSLPPLLPRS